MPLQLARAVNEVWSMDFVSDRLASGRQIKYLTVADDFSRECALIDADSGISGEYVTLPAGRDGAIPRLPACRAH